MRRNIKKEIERISDLIYKTGVVDEEVGDYFGTPIAFDTYATSNKAYAELEKLFPSLWMKHYSLVHGKMAFAQEILHYLKKYLEDDGSTIPIKEPVKLELIYGKLKKKNVEVEAENIYHLENIMTGYLIVCEEGEKEQPHTVKVISPKWIKKHITHVSSKDW